MATSKRGTKAPRAPRATKPDSLRAGVEPSVRIFTELSLERIVYAERAADAGNIRPAADICDWLLADDRIAGLLHTRIQSLLGLDPTFQTSGDRRRSKRTARILESEEDYLASYPETDTTLMLVWGILLGIAPMRHRWPTDPEHGNRLLPTPEFWHPQHLRQDPATRQWKTRVATPGQATGFSQEIDVTPGDGTWILHMPYGPHRPVMNGIWRGLARWALVKHLAIWDWSRLGEKGGLLVAETQPGMLSTASKYASTEEQRTQLAEDLYQRGREAVAVLPPGYNAKLIESLADSRAIYKAQIDMANEAFAITIRGGNLTTQVVGGSLAAAEVQERVGEDAKRRFDAQTFTTTIHDQSLVWWAQFNFGDPRLAPWPVYPVRDAEDPQKRGLGIQAMIDAVTHAVNDLGFELDRDTFAQEFDLGDFLQPTQSEPNPGSKEARDAAKAAAAEAMKAARQQPPPEPPPKAPKKKTKKAPAETAVAA
jgi:phage gp29-like protein